MRCGLGLVEILVAFLVLGVGLIPAFDLFGAGRTALATGRTMLSLEAAALEEISGRLGEVGAGRYSDLGGDEEERFEALDPATPGILRRSSLRRSGDGLSFLLEVEAVSENRSFTLRCRVADPLAGLAPPVEPMLGGESP